MKKPFLEIAVVIGVSTVVIGFTALAYAFSKQPEEVYARQVFVNGFSNIDSTVYENFEEWDLAIKSWTEARLLEPLVLTSERGEMAVTLTALGVEPDWNKLDKQLKNFMEESGPFEKLSTYFLGNTVEVPLTLNENTLNATLALSGFEQGEKNASFIYENEVLGITPQQLGYGIEKEPLRSFLEESLSAPNLDDTFVLTLRTKEPEVTDQELELLTPVVSTLQPLIVTLKDEYGNTWELSITDFAPWIVPAWDSEVPPSTLPWKLDETAFISYAETVLAPELEEDPQSVVITENTDGSYSFEGSARFGKELDKTALGQSLTEILMSGQATEPLALPITEVEPVITVPDSLKARGITDLVGVGYSDFSGSPSNRIHNINTGIAFYNGVFVEQGAEFSFMEHMPEVDASNGFLPELVIKGDDTIPEYGGGLCQVSSTMFRAVLYSGLPITARKNHSYAVAYYARPFGYGLDATVYDPAPDLKFINDTPGDILVQAYTEGSSAYYVFYGTNDGRTVTMEGPYSYDYRSIPPSVTEYTSALAPGERQLESYGHAGFTTDWYRTVTYLIPTEEELLADPTLYVSPYAETASGVAELIHSVYGARPAKYLEGTPTEATEE